MDLSLSRKRHSIFTLKEIHIQEEIASPLAVKEEGPVVSSKPRERKRSRGRGDRHEFDAVVIMLPPLGL